jgi:hypothetical protein
MNKKFLLLVVTVFFSSLYPTPLTQLHHDFAVKVRNFSQCLRGNRDCNPNKVRIIRLGTALILALVTTGTVGGIYIWHQRKKAILAPTIPTEKGNHPSTSKKNDMSAVLQQLRNEELINAIQKGYAQEVSTALKNNADPNAFYNGTPLLSLAIQKGNPTVLNVLLSSNINLTMEDENGDTPLMYALKHKHPATAIHLIKRIPNLRDIDKANNQGMTPLMVAAQKGENIVIPALLATGVPLNAQNNEGKTALDLAREANHTTTIKLLEQALNKHGVSK